LKYSMHIDEHTRKTGSCFSGLQGNAG